MNKTLERRIARLEGLRAQRRRRAVVFDDELETMTGTHAILVLPRELDVDEWSQRATEHWQQQQHAAAIIDRDED